MPTISFKATQGVYLLYKNYTYRAPQVFGEFIDNAIQSYEDHKNLLTVDDPNFKLKVEIEIEWHMDSDSVVKANKITIRDNAAGMTAERFAIAFDLANPDAVRTGMNEFGVGMKAAASWLGNKWHIETTSITDKVTRVVDVDLTEICNKDIRELESKETIIPDAHHGTTIVIEELWDENVIKKNSIEELNKSIASIYRYFLRRKELQISVGEELLDFDDYEVLEAPSYKDPEGEDIKWKCNVTTSDSKGHSLSGFVALLKDTKDERRGVVIMRNHRVVLGFDPKDRTIGKEFMGQIGSAKYRRVFGELEITGFKVAFGKNQVNDQDLLEALCTQAAGKLKINGVSLLTQCDKYKSRKKSTPKPTPAPTPVSVPTPPSPQPGPEPTPEPATTTPTPTPAPTPVPAPPGSTPTDIIAKGSFKFGGASYQIILKDSNELNELFWNDLSQKSSDVLICKVNLNHPFFKSFGKPEKQTIAMIKALSIAKFKATIDSAGSATVMMNEFNQIINSQEAPE